MTELDLAPCPFCGGKASCSPADDSGEVVFAVACMSCLAQITKCDEAGAIQQWNTRAEAADKLEALSREKATLREALETARDMLLERVHGNPARSAAHNARVIIEAALAQTQSEG